MNRLDYLLAAHAQTCLGFEANEPCNHIRIRIVLRIVSQTSTLYGVGEGSTTFYNRDVAEKELISDIQRLTDLGLLQEVHKQERIRLQDGTYRYEPKFVGHTTTAEADQIVARLFDPEQQRDNTAIDPLTLTKVRTDLYRAHCLAATDLYHIRQYADVPSALPLLESLATKLAEPEPWTYRQAPSIEPLPILSSYIGLHIPAVP